MITLENTSVNLVHAADGRSWSGPIYVATPQLLSAFGIKQSQVNPDADILTMRPGLSTMSLMQLTYGDQGARRPGLRPGEAGTGPTARTRGPARREAASPTRPSRRSASSRPARPRRTRWSPSTRSPHCTCKSPSASLGWLIQVPNGLTATQVTDAQRIAAVAGMGVETRNSIPSLAQIIDAATLFGIVLAIGILGMSVGLVRSEAARDLRTLTATGAGGVTRRTITATTAGALGFTGAVVGIIGGYLAAIGFFRSNSLDGLSSLTSIPVTNLLVILVGMPLVATVLGWLLAGRDPGSIPASRSNNARRSLAPHSPAG